MKDRKKINAMKEKHHELKNALKIMSMMTATIRMMFSMIILSQFQAVMLSKN